MLSDDHEERVDDGSSSNASHHPQHHGTSLWPRSYQGEGSTLLRYYDKFISSKAPSSPSRGEAAIVLADDAAKWQCVSPMTRHVFPTSGDNHHPNQRSQRRQHRGQPQNHASSQQAQQARRARHRSRSFGDYVLGASDEYSMPAVMADGVFPLDDAPSWNERTGRGRGNGSTEIAAVQKNHRRYIEPIATTATTTPHQHGAGINRHRRDHDQTTTHTHDEDYGSDEPPSAHEQRRTEEVESDDSNERKDIEIDVNSDDGDDDRGGANSFWISLLYGMINATIVLPVVMSFGNIIYRDDAFLPYMPVLIKLTLVSGMVHQLCFSTLSTLTFAVGSVQDAGLIFLSSMAADMVRHCQARGYDDDALLATVTVGLAVATPLLGVGLVLIGRMGLAGYVQMLPTCVVAGYLAYIGWFVGYSGLGIMVGVSTVTPRLLWENVAHVLPGVVGGVFIYTSVQTFRHVAVLPVCIFLLLVVFYAGLAVTGSSIDAATEGGWIRKTDPAPAITQTWDYLQPSKVVWSALPQLWLTWTGMLFVVALSSSLDVAAIELEVQRPLDYNRELRMVGISNMVSGLTGGYTGSYIFSQSIFSLRIGIRSRVAGFSLAFFQFLVIMLPFPVLCYVPNFFYGSLLLMICIDLMYEWLWEFRRKVTIAAYLIVLATFALIHATGVEYGIIGGVVLYVACHQLRINVGELKQIPTEDDFSDTSERVDLGGGQHKDAGTTIDSDTREEILRLVQNRTNRDSYATF